MIRLVFCDYGFSVSDFLQHLPSYLGFSYLGRGVSLHGCSSKVQPLLLTLWLTLCWFLYMIQLGVEPHPPLFFFLKNPRSGYTEWGCKESDRTESTDHAHVFLHMDLTFIQLHLLKRLSLIWFPWQLYWASNDHICMGPFLHFLFFSIDVCVYIFVNTTISWLL